MAHAGIGWEKASASCLPGRWSVVFPAGGEPERGVATPDRQGVEAGRGHPSVPGQHDRDLLRHRPFDEADREITARPASEARAEPVGDPLRERGYVPRTRFEGELGCRFDELPVGDGVAQADVHDPGHPEVQRVPILNRNHSDSQPKNQQQRRTILRNAESP